MAMNPNLQIRGTAARTIGGMGPRGVPYIELLATMLEDSAMEVRPKTPNLEPHLEATAEK